MAERSAPVSPVPRQPALLRESSARPQSLPLLVAALTRLAAAASAVEVAAAAVEAAVAITGARGGALGVQDGDDVRLLASAGYDCDVMEAGATLPLDAGLPVTEAVRTGRTVVRGPADAPSWVAAALVAGSDRAALLVSLPPDNDPDVAALETLALATGGALTRVSATTDEHDALAAVVRSLRAMPVQRPPWLDAAMTVQAATGDPTEPGGDVVALLRGSSPDIAWLLVADVCGEGLAAAPAAAQFRNVAGALARDDMDPDELLDAIDAALTRDPTAERFVTAAAVRLLRHGDAVEAAIATAGHPAALLWRDGQVTQVGEVGLPLNLRLPDEVRRSMATTVITLGPADLLLLHTDGFVDRGTADRTAELVELFGRAGVLGDARAVVEVLVGAMTAAVDPPRDDLAVAVVSPRLPG